MTVSFPRATVAVRGARPEDAAAIAEIYNAGIRSRTATFETVERSPDDVLVWITASDVGAQPLLVAVRSGQDTSEVVGFARASIYRPRACYAGIGEFSVYVAEHARGQRIGDALMQSFLPACANAGLWKLVSRIFSENASSRALCARHGFREVGTYAKHAMLDGAWRDVVIVERGLR